MSTDNGSDPSVLQASPDLHPGRYASPAEGGALREAAHGLQRRMEHVQALHQGKAQEQSK